MSAKLTVDNMKKLIAYAEKIGVAHFDIVKINEPFIHLQTVVGQQVIDIRTSNVGVRRLIKADPIEEEL